MRISVLGNSNTTGRYLHPGEVPWPGLVQQQLESSLGEPVTVDNWRFAPYRPAAAAYAIELVAEAAPDAVVIPLASYWCAYTTVQQSVQRRFGSHAASLYTRAEGLYRRRAESSGRPAGPRKGWARTVVRKTLGSAPILTVPEFIDVYSTIIRELSRREDLQIILYGDRALSAGLREAMPAIEPALNRIEAVFKSFVLERRLQWADLEQAFTGGDGSQPLLLDDGIHMTPAAHERTAALLLPLFSSHAATGQDAGQVRVWPASVSSDRGR